MAASIGNKNIIEIRLDPPAFDDGQDHIFDRLPRKLSAGVMVDWKRQKFSEIAQACEPKSWGSLQYSRYQHRQPPTTLPSTRCDPHTLRAALLRARNRQGRDATE